jgi:hypothetical protein
MRRTIPCPISPVKGSLEQELGDNGSEGVAGGSPDSVGDAQR